MLQSLKERVCDSHPFSWSTSWSPFSRWLYLHPKTDEGAREFMYLNKHHSAQVLCVKFSYFGCDPLAFIFTASWPSSRPPGSRSFNRLLRDSVHLVLLNLFHLSSIYLSHCTSLTCCGLRGRPLPRLGAGAASSGAAVSI